MEDPASSGDELLDSLQLHPAADMDELLPAAPELELGLGDNFPSDESEEVETLDLDEALLNTGPVPVPASPPPPPPKQAQPGKITLVSKPEEADDLRRRINRPSIPELTLSDLDEIEDDEFDLTFEPDPPPPPARRPGAASAVRVDTLPPGSKVQQTKRPEPIRAVAPPAPPPERETRGEVATVATAPVTVQLPGSHGQTDVSIPVEVTLGRGTAQVTIHLRLTLNLNLQP
ncbi:MAG TPA: hypothetical protein VIC87_19180 [Vicinamibacteria bacterium]|jgi:hypothetical protein